MTTEERLTAYAATIAQKRYPRRRGDYFDNEQMERAALAYQQDGSCRDELWLGIWKLARAVCNAYHADEDLIMDGTILVIEYLHTFDPSRGDLFFWASTSVKNLIYWRTKQATQRRFHHERIAQGLDPVPYARRG